MGASLTVGLVQLTSTPDLAATVAHACGCIQDAAVAGAQLVLLPENAAMMGREREVRAAAANEADHPALAAFRAAATDAGVWLLAGSVAVPAGDGRLHNRSILFDEHGRRVAHYDKIHMFDVDLANGERYRESANFAPGGAACMAQTPWGRLGMTVCYDLRFPHLFRALAQAGAALISVPSAFTRPTGAAHWHVLLRARAIETGCFILAPAQCGRHYGRRETYGHSLVVDPWGEIVAEAGETPELLVTTLDLTRIGAARAMVASLDHDRPFTPPNHSPLKAAE